MVNFRQLAARIDENPKVVKGAAIGLGVRLHVSSTGIWMSVADADRVAAVIEKYRAATLVAA